MKYSKWQDLIRLSEGVAGFHSPLAAFTEGLCYLLAIEVANITGMDLYQFGGCHMLVSPDGKNFLDIGGWRLDYEIEDIWGPSSLEEPEFSRITEEEALDWDFTDWNTDLEIQAYTSKWAEKLIKEFLDAAYNPK